MSDPILFALISAIGSIVIVSIGIGLYRLRRDIKFNKDLDGSDKDTDNLSYKYAASSTAFTSNRHSVNPFYSIDGSDSHYINPGLAETLSQEFIASRNRASVIHLLGISPRDEATNLSHSTKSIGDTLRLRNRSSSVCNNPASIDLGSSNSRKSVYGISIHEILAGSDSAPTSSSPRAFPCTLRPTTMSAKSTLLSGSRQGSRQCSPRPTEILSSNSVSEDVIDRNSNDRRIRGHRNRVQSAFTNGGSAAERVDSKKDT